MILQIDKNTGVGINRVEFWVPASTSLKRARASGTQGTVVLQSA